MRRWEKGRTEGWGGSEGRIGKAECGIKKRGKHRREGDREMGGVGEGEMGGVGSRREGDGMMRVWPETSPSVVSPGLKESGSNGSVDKCGSEIYLYVKEGSSFRLTFQDVVFNTFKTVFKFSGSYSSLIKQLAAANPCAARKSSFSFFTTQSFPGSSGS